MQPATPPRQPVAASRRRPARAWLPVLWAGAAALAQPAAPAPVADDFASQVLAEVNLYRQRHQQPPLHPAPWLATLAAEHSAHMAQLGGLSHAGFLSRVLRSRRQTCVENLAAGFGRADQVVLGWQASPDHLQNLLDARVQDVGVASVRGHVTWLACSAAGPAGR